MAKMRARAKGRSARSRIPPVLRCTESCLAAKERAGLRRPFLSAAPVARAWPGSACLGRGFRLRRLRRLALPAAGLALVLLLQPLLQRGEVLQHRAAVDLLAAGQLLQRGLPRLAGAAREHGLELPAGLRVAVERALVQRAGVAGGLAQRLVELELQQVRQEVA